MAVPGLLNSGNMEHMNYEQLTRTAKAPGASTVVETERLCDSF